MPYTSAKPDLAPSTEELRSRIPGWGADLDQANRPSWPMQQEDIEPTGAHWDFPERQKDDPRRERSIEHKFLTPVYGTAQPLHGLSGVIRRFAYDRFGEDRNTRWLLLVVGDRVEATGAHIRSLFSRHPDNPITQTGILAEAAHRPLRSRFGRGRLDVRHTWMDPIIVAGPWLLGIAVIAGMLRRRR